MNHKGELFLVFLLFLVACVAEETSTEINQSQQDNIITASVINSTNPKANCHNECIKNACIDNDYYKCVVLENGCNYFVKLGPTKGQCGMECFNDYDCPYYQDCIDNSTKYYARTVCVNVSDNIARMRLDLMNQGKDYR